jgi:hypothetical protein
MKKKAENYQERFRFIGDERVPARTIVPSALSPLNDIDHAPWSGTVAFQDNLLSLSVTVLRQRVAAGVAHT